MIQTPGEIHSGYFGHPGRQRSGVFCPGIEVKGRKAHDPVSLRDVRVLGEWCRRQGKYEG